jgi:adenylate kinase
MKKILLLFYFIFSMQTLFGYKHFILISAPGSGKGTFSQYCKKHHGYEQICPGDIFRNEIALRTDFGIKIQPIVDKGEYIDEEIVCAIIEQYISDALQKHKHFILDGFPRSDVSFKFLCSLIKKYNIKDSVCFLQFIASDEICVDRIVNRLVCTHCFMVYSRTCDDMNDASACGNCQMAMSRRKADTQEIAQNRIAYFHQNIEPLLQHAELSYPTQKIYNDCSISELQEKYEKLFNEK